MVYFGIQLNNMLICHFVFLAHLQDGATLLHYAVQTASSPAIKILLLYNVDINLQDNVWFMIICFLLRFFPPTPNYLLFYWEKEKKIFICPFQDGWTPLHLAVQARRTDIVKLLLIKGADKTSKNRVNINLFVLLFSDRL